MFTTNPRSHRAGSTLVEVSFAVGLVAFAFSSLFVMYSTALGLIRKQQETIGANLVLQERTEQIRACNLTILTDPSRLQAAVLSAPTGAGSRLVNLIEEVTISVYPAASPMPTPLKVRRANGSNTVISTPPISALAASPCIRADVRLSWKSEKRTRSREASILVAVGGASR